MHNRSWLFIASKSLAICKIVSKIYVGVNMRQKKKKKNILAAPVEGENI